MSLSRIDVKFFKMAVSTSYIKRETDVDIAARCPVCSSDERWKHSSRLHLYTKNNITNVNCFSGDCAIKNKTMYSFLKEFHPNLLGQYKRENFGNTMEKLARGESDVFSQFKKEPKEDQTQIVHHDLTGFFKDISQAPAALQYLDNRGCTYDETKFGKWYFSEQNLKIGDKFYATINSIVIPLYHNNTMYGFYSRNIHTKDFATYNPDQNVGFKIWNWFNVDKDKPVYIYEGIFDAIAGGLSNSIALMGAKIPEERLKELKYPVFVLDNDKAGITNSIEYTKRNCQIYIQPDSYIEKDMNELKLGNPDLNLPEFIKSNLYQGISAEVRLKCKL